jgi:hypothetical protein
MIAQVAVIMDSKTELKSKITFTSPEYNIVTFSGMDRYSLETLQKIKQISKPRVMQIINHLSIGVLSVSFAAFLPPVPPKTGKRGRDKGDDLTVAVNKKSADRLTRLRSLVPYLNGGDAPKTATVSEIIKASQSPHYEIRGFDKLDLDELIFLFNVDGDDYSVFKNMEIVIENNQGCVIIWKKEQ